MKLIKSSSEILEQAPGLEGIYEAIERAGRTCYKSERPEGKTAKDFVDMLIKRGHLSPLEHGTVYLKVPNDILFEYMNPDYCIGEKYIIDHDWVQCYIDGMNDITYITSNYRWIVENNLEEFLKYLCEPIEYHEKRVSVKFTTNIGVSREANRHRKNSVSEQSTRYCNYSKEKFDNEISINIPEFIKDYNLVNSYKNAKNKESWLINYAHEICNNYENPCMHLIDYWTFGNLATEYAYMGMIKCGARPEQARSVLPLDTNTEVVYTAFISDWENFLKLRTDKASHPDMRAIAIPLKEEFINRNYIKE